MGLKANLLPVFLLVALLVVAGCGKEAGDAEKPGPLPTFQALVEKGTTPDVCGGSFESVGVSAAGRKAGVRGIAIARCTASDEIQQLGIIEAASEAEALEIAVGAAYTFAGEDAGQASRGGNVTCVMDEAKPKRHVCSQALGRLVLVAVGPEGNRSLGSPAEVKGLPEFQRWLDGQRSGG